ncbi:hypothetical protein TraAM80_00791 [Trypanosoma rangeli]|uniref:Uncharacterized protein n=1 Tax=Trypanosoma rangeli TaxID=5698 RepID=A0A3R7NTV6_TRYRA|nr:uncharacterized protein TraAM80_00791 [Trypanosoma rangeli]RNF11599.1 hypothetical protein TraAM80_00791 [Trypanosoma rangeli]|eukprot:RNF11599.1 hypothetical protein TraAM80_00791 [Trypanosoma rangeli]
MSDLRGAGRPGDDGKENRKRRQRSEPACGALSGWQIASNSRCLACGRLGSMCDCNKTKIDPQLKRRKLDSILQHTPYVRCKQLRALDEISREESKYRRRLVDRWGDEVELIRQVAFTHRRILLLLLQETASREALLAAERKAWLEGMAAGDRHIVLFATSSHEREERWRLYAAAQREVQVLMTWHGAMFDCLSLKTREAAFRDALVNHEAAARAALISHNFELLNRMDADARERRSLYEVFRERREQLVTEWQGGTEVLRSAIVMDQRRVAWMMQGRVQMCELCERQRAKLSAEEEESRMRVYGLAREELHTVMERGRVCEEQRSAFVQQEAGARNAIMQDEAAACNALGLVFTHGAKEALETEQLKYEQRGAALHAAIHQLKSIVEEEAAAFASLNAQEHREKDLCYQWMFEKGRQRKELEHVAFHHLRLVVEEEEVARQAALTSMQEEEVGIAACLQHKTRMLRELVDTALGQKGEIRLQEHEQRFALVSHKAGQEDAVRRWIENKECVRQSLMAEETTHRIHTVETEHAAREELSWRFDTGQDACQALMHERIEKQRAFQQKALQVLHDILEQETSARLLMWRLVQDDRERATHESNHRQMLEMCNAEAEYRTYVVQQEVRHRESIATQMHLQETFFTKEAQELLKARICELVAIEESQRIVFLRLYSEATELLYFASRQSWEEAERCKKERVLAELRDREVALVEDARVYREDELLVFCHVEPLSQELHDPAAAPLTQESWNAQRELIFAELSGDKDDVASLTPAAVGFLAGAIDAVSRRESSLTAALHQAEVALKEASKKVIHQRQLLSNTKERWEELKKNWTVTLLNTKHAWRCTATHDRGMRGS